MMVDSGTDMPELCFVQAKKRKEVLKKPVFNALLNDDRLNSFEFGAIDNLI